MMSMKLLRYDGRQSEIDGIVHEGNRAMLTIKQASVQ